MRQLSVRLLIVLALAGAIMPGTTGCGDDVTDLTEIVNQFFAATRADAILTTVNNYWFKPTGTSINGGLAPLSNFPALYCCSNGSAIYVYYEELESELTEGPGGDLVAAFFGFINASGTMYPPVRVRGDFIGIEESSVLAIFNQHGDASIAFVGLQARDESTQDGSSPDKESLRVYYTYFDADLAATADNGDGMEYGFNTWATAVDRNTPHDDDEDDIGELFFATNLVDGDARFSGLSESYELFGRCSGTRGFSTDWFLSFGWTGIETDNNGGDEVEFFIEVAAVDLDSSSETYLQLMDAVPIDPDHDLSDDPGFSGGDDSITEVWTSGRDILFIVSDDDNGQGISETYVNIARIDLADGTLESTSATRVAREEGVNTGASVSIETVVGHGSYPYTGQMGTWIIIEESNLDDDDGITNDDTDLVIARVAGDDISTVEIDEFDNEAADSADENDVTIRDWQLAFGGTHGVFWFTQIEDTAASTGAASLYAIGVVFTDGSAGNFTNCITAIEPVTSGEDDDEGDTDILGVGVPTVNTEGVASCGFQSDPLVFGATYRREVDDEPELNDLGLATVTFSAVEQDPASAPELTGTEATIATQDTSWGTFEEQLIDAGNGGFLVFFEMNGNNPEDDPADGNGEFDEPRLYAFGVDLEGNQDLGLQEVCSGVLDDDLAFPDDRRVSFGFPYAAPGNVGPGRDQTFDLESHAPDFCHLFLGEKTDAAGSPLSILRSRTIDLRSNSSFASAADRFYPSLDEAPHDITKGNAFEAAPYGLASEGSNVTMLVAESGINVALQVTTLNTSDYSWVCPAVITNDDIPTTAGVAEAIMYPGWNATDCCPRILGGWIFYARVTLGFIGLGPGELSYQLQARRIIGLNLPDEE